MSQPNNWQSTLDWVIIDNRKISSQFWRLGSLRSWPLQILCLVRTYFLPSRWHRLGEPTHCGRAEGLTGSLRLLIKKGVSPHSWGLEPSWSNYLLKAQLLILLWRLSFNVGKGEEREQKHLAHSMPHWPSKSLSPQVEYTHCIHSPPKSCSSTNSKI